MSMRSSRSKHHLIFTRLAPIMNHFCKSVMKKSWLLLKKQTRREVKNNMVFDNLLSRWQLSRFPSFFDEDQNWLMMPRDISGLSISEDNKGVYVEAAVPGINPDNIEVTYNRGVLWIRAEAEEEEKDKNKKYYRKSSRSFSYRVTVPGNGDE